MISQKTQIIGFSYNNHDLRESTELQFSSESREDKFFCHANIALSLEAVEYCWRREL